MATPVNRNAGNSRAVRGRKRAPLVSVVTSICLLIACVIFAGIYFWGEKPETDNNSPEPAIDTPPAASTFMTETPPSTEPPVSAPHVKPPVVRGIYIGAWNIGSEDLNRFAELCGDGVYNSLVIDVKDDMGYITFINDNANLTEASRYAVLDLERSIPRLKERGVYTIARLVCFKDPLRCSLEPRLAVHNNYGGTWKDAEDIAWLDPYNTAAWDYIISVAKEAARIGFDEVQLDYVRFPTDGNLDEINYGSAGAGKTKAGAIGEFLAYARSALAGTNVKLAADVFGIIAVSKGDFEGIGQDLDIVLRNVDYVCPMVYPSHFANKRQNGVGQIINDVLFETPDLDPYGVVHNLMLMVKDRLPADESHAVIRPYLQAFTAGYLGKGYYKVYTAQEVADQIKAVYDAGFDEWILWNDTGEYGFYESISNLLISKAD